MVRGLATMESRGLPTGLPSAPTPLLEELSWKPRVEGGRGERREEEGGGKAEEERGGGMI